MNKITLGFFRTTINSYFKGILMLFILLFMNTQLSWGQSAIIPKLYFTAKNTPSGSTGWTFVNATMNNASSDYWKMITSSAGSVVTSPVMDFSGYSGITITVVTSSFGAVVSNSDYLKLEYFNGSTWSQVAFGNTATAYSSAISLPYTYSGAQIRFTATNATGTVGARLTSVEIKGLAVISGPEINIKGNGISIVDGASPATTTNGTDFGTLATNTGVTKTYTIENLGSVDLVLASPYVQLASASTAFTITEPTLTTIPASSSTTFDVTFNSATEGTFNNGIEVLSNDADEGVYDFAIKAIAQVPTPIILVKGNSTLISVGDTTPSTLDGTDFGNTLADNNVVKTYTIENTGTGTLHINNIQMNIGTGYTIAGISLPNTVLPGGTTTFTVTFNSAVLGTFADTVIINNDDSTNSSYTFAVTTKVVAINFGVGDISITALANDAPDGISFVNWKAIPVDAELIFTDNAWDGSALLVNENSMIWKNDTGSVIPVGTVIYIDAVVPLADLGSVTGALSGLSTSGENLFIYEGSAANPSFVYGLSNLPWITTGTVNTNNSYLPAVLNVTNANIVTGDFDNVEYSGDLAPKDDKSSFAAYKTLVNDPANWTKNNTYFTLNSVDFELAAVWEAAAWTDGLTPTAALKTVIKDTYSTTTNGIFNVKKLTVKASAALTINSGTNVTVQNEVNNNGNIVVENNANLIQVNNTTNTGNVVVNRNSNDLYRLDYTMWSSPVAIQNLATFSPMTSQAPSRFYTYDSAANLYSTIASPTSTNFAAGTGYLIRMPNDASAVTPTPYLGVFTGVPNNGNVSLTGLTSGLYYAVGNPYPSTISAESFLAANSTDGVLYFWRKTNAALGSAYATYTLGGVTSTSPTSAIPNGTIQVGQGFIVKTGVAATTLNFTNTMRAGSLSTQSFKTKQVVERNRIWLNLTNTSGVFSQALVGYMTDATQGVDVGMDGAYINDSPVALTSNINNVDYTIQGRALPFDPTDVVALNFKTDVAGDYSIAIDHADGLFATGQDIYLVDSATGTETDLKAGAYTFTAAAGVDNARFSLKYQKTLKVDAPAFNENSVSVYKNSGNLYVNSTLNSINTIKVFDMQGRLIVEQKNVKANTATIKNVNVNQQVIIVQVTSENNIIVSKKVVN